MPNRPPPERQREIETGKNFAIGVGHAIRDAMPMVAAAFLLAMLVSYCTPAISIDATDKDPAHRSGVTLRIDHGTGCQYLETRRGGITPRLDRVGQQVCK